MHSSVRHFSEKIGFTAAAVECSIFITLIIALCINFSPHSHSTKPFTASNFKSLESRQIQPPHSLFFSVWFQCHLIALSVKQWSALYINHMHVWTCKLHDAFAIFYSQFRCRAFVRHTVKGVVLPEQRHCCKWERFTASHSLQISCRERQREGFPLK